MSEKKVITLLNDLGIKYTTNSMIYTFKIFEDDLNFEKLKKFIDKKIISDFSGNAKYYYTSDEINSTEWFVIRSTHHWSYPQPENNYNNIIYDNSNYCTGCGSGLIQKDIFQMKKEPSWGKRNFIHLHWVMDELFINSRILNNFKSQNFTGIEIENVNFYKKNIVLNTVKHLKICNILEKSFFIENPEKIITCEKCNKTKYVLGWGGFYKFNKTILNNNNCDFIKSHEIFGDGLMASRYIIASKKVLNYFILNKIDEIEFKPIVLI
jgi:hypothetical protein